MVGTKQSTMKKNIIITTVLFVASFALMSFCGFYVSKADGTLKNKTSQVIMVRDGNRNAITMYNDFKGNTKDFAMVVPVPVVLKKEDIKVVDPSIFQKLNDYSAPRLVEYWDQNPCNAYGRESLDDVKMVPQAALSEVVITGLNKRKSVVKIEAQYLVGEYDILILSAKESSGLKYWLNENGYKIPENAEEVLDPYIKSNLKFFVVKVNEKEKEKLNNNFLRPIQIKFTSPKFMLPIRLGMANADGDQDLIVYSFTRKGRVECTNYRNVNVPTGNNVPLFVQKNFGSFYGNVFNHQWQKENKSIAILEYAWNVTPVNPMKCDPCVGNPPTEQDLVNSGVWWLYGKDWNDYSDTEEDDELEIDNGSRNVHFTRLHFRYNRNSFPQDLSFQVTPNQETFQARYVITHPAQGDLSCQAGQQYLKQLKARRKKEVNELMNLTGKDLNNWQDVAYDQTENLQNKTCTYASIIKEVKKENDEKNDGNTGLIIFGAAILVSVGFMRYKVMV